MWVDEVIVDVSIHIEPRSRLLIRAPTIISIHLLSCSIIHSMIYPVSSTSYHHPLTTLVCHKSRLPLNHTHIPLTGQHPSPLLAHIRPNLCEWLYLRTCISLFPLHPQQTSQHSHPPYTSHTYLWPYFAICKVAVQVMYSLSPPSSTSHCWM